MNALRRLWRALKGRVELVTDTECSECLGQGYDAGGQMCACVHPADHEIGRQS